MVCVILSSIKNILFLIYRNTKFIFSFLLHFVYYLFLSLNSVKARKNGSRYTCKFKLTLVFIYSYIFIFPVGRKSKSKRNNRRSYKASWKREKNSGKPNPGEKHDKQYTAVSILSPNTCKRPREFISDAS